MLYRYEGFTADGKVKHGYIDSDTIEKANEQLRAMGIFSLKTEPDSQTPQKTIFAKTEESAKTAVIESVSPTSPSDETKAIRVQNLQTKLKNIADFQTYINNLPNKDLEGLNKDTWNSATESAFVYLLRHAIITSYLGDHERTE
jgi:hypothetical protein